MRQTNHIEQKVLEQDEQKAYEYALKLLTRREYSRKELYLKLKQRYGHELAAETLQHCIRANLQSDERYTQMLARHMVYQGYGPIKFAMSCKSQNISSEISQTILQETDWLEVCVEIMRKKAPRYLNEGEDAQAKPDFAQKQKIMAMLYRRGFTSTLISEALEAYARKTDF